MSLRAKRGNLILDVMSKHPCIYIVTNGYNQVLYTGVTSDLRKRMHQHRNGTVLGFSKRYKAVKLVYYEVCDDMYGAIQREKQLKAGPRSKKIQLIRSMNPEWRDLSDSI